MCSIHCLRWPFATDKPPDASRVYRRWLVALLGVGLSCFFSIGCSKVNKNPSTIRVRGRVEYKGLPLTNGSIQFVPAPGEKVRPARGIIGSDGQFAMSTFEAGDGVQPGEYLVSIISFRGDPDSPDSKESSEKMALASEPKIPKEFSNPKESGLRTTISAEAGGFVTLKLPDTPPQIAPTSTPPVGTAPPIALPTPPPAATLEWSSDTLGNIAEASGMEPATQLIFGAVALAAIALLAATIVSRRQKLQAVGSGAGAAQFGSAELAADGQASPQMSTAERAAAIYTRRTNAQLRTPLAAVADQPKTTEESSTESPAKAVAQVAAPFAAASRGATAPESPVESDDFFAEYVLAESSPSESGIARGKSPFPETSPEHSTEPAIPDSMSPPVDEDAPGNGSTAERAGIMEEEATDGESTEEAAGEETARHERPSGEPASGESAEYEMAGVPSAEADAAGTEAAGREARTEEATGEQVEVEHSVDSSSGDDGGLSMEGTEAEEHGEELTDENAGQHETAGVEAAGDDAGGDESAEGEAAGDEPDDEKPAEEEGAEEKSARAEASHARAVQFGLERRVAEWALHAKGSAYLQLTTTKAVEIEHLEDLPARPFHVLGLAFGKFNHEISDDDLKPLSDLKYLQTLDLSSTPVTDAGMPHLMGLRNLAGLSLARTDVTDRGLSSLTGLTGLRVLRLQKTRIMDAGLAFLGGMSRLETLELKETAISDSGLAHLSDLENVVYLDLGNTAVGDAGLVHLKSMRRLARLALSQTAVTDAGLEHLSGLAALGVLLLFKTAVADAGLRHLEQLAKLETLELKSTRVTDEGLESLARLSALRHLYLKDTAVTEQGLQWLKVALPACKISG